MANPLVCANELVKIGRVDARDHAGIPVGMRCETDPEALAERFEEARKHLEMKQHDVAAALFPGDQSRRTRYNTLLRTMKNGGAPKWDVLVRLVTFFASHGYHVMWLLFGRGPKNIMQSGRELDIPLPPALTPTGIRIRKRRG